MAEKTLRARFGMVFTKQELERMVFIFAGNGEVTVQADVHGMTCQEARAFLKNLIAVIRYSFRLVVIHGFHRGTCIRDMVRSEKLSDKVVGTKCFLENDGITELDVRALCV